MFTALGMSALIPITSGLLLHGIQGMNQRITLFPWLGIEFGCYLTGAILYAVSNAVAVWGCPLTEAPDQIPGEDKSWKV